MEAKSTGRNRLRTAMTRDAKARVRQTTSKTLGPESSAVDPCWRLARQTGPAMLLTGPAIDLTDPKALQATLAAFTRTPHGRRRRRRGKLRTYGRRFNDRAVRTGHEGRRRRRRRRAGFAQPRHRTVGAGLRRRFPRRGRARGHGDRGRQNKHHPFHSVLRQDTRGLLRRRS